MLYILVIIGSGNGLVLVGTKPLPDPMLIIITEILWGLTRVNSKELIQILTHCGLGMPYASGMVNVDLPSGSCGIHSRVMFTWMPRYHSPNCVQNLHIWNNNLHLPGDNEIINIMSLELTQHKLLSHLWPGDKSVQIYPGLSLHLKLIVYLQYIL